MDALAEQWSWRTFSGFRVCTVLGTDRLMIGWPSGGITTCPPDAELVSGLYAQTDAFRRARDVYRCVSGDYRIYGAFSLERDRL